jgi:hypothetical protein
MTRRIGFVGCVKAKGGEPTAAQDLYISPLFRGRRRAVARTCTEWWILSAAHGLVHPRTVVAPYDVTLTTMTAAERRRWAERVAAQIDEHIGLGPGDVVELHAGDAYGGFGLVDAIRARGATVEQPTAGMKIGRQLAHYAATGAPAPTSSDLDRFYGLLDVAARRTEGPRHLAECTAGSGWPTRGVYFFFEPGEVRRDGAAPRVVRVGTHALTNSRTTLWQRLAAHRGSAGGSMPGGGNHRGSIFRLHVGAALLASGVADPALGSTWGVGSSAPRAVREAEYPLERAVSAVIGAMRLVWVGIDDPPGPGSDRGVVERGAIALLSGGGDAPPDPASPAWLGHHAQRAAIRSSGLWNVNHVDEGGDPRFLDVLARWVSA